MFRSKQKLRKINVKFISSEQQKQCFITSCIKGYPRMIHKFSSYDIEEKCYLDCFNTIKLTANKDTLKALIASIIRYTDLNFTKLVDELNEKRQDIIMLY